MKRDFLTLHNYSEKEIILFIKKAMYLKKSRRLSKKLKGKSSNWTYLPVSFVPNSLLKRLALEPVI